MCQYRRLFEMQLFIETFYYSNDRWPAHLFNSIQWYYWWPVMTSYRYSKAIDTGSIIVWLLSILPIPTDDDTTPTRDPIVTRGPHCYCSSMLRYDPWLRLFWPIDVWPLVLLLENSLTIDRWPHLITVCDYLFPIGDNWWWSLEDDDRWLADTNIVIDVLLVLIRWRPVFIDDYYWYWLWLWWHWRKRALLWLLMIIDGMTIVYLFAGDIIDYGDWYIPQ